VGGRAWSYPERVEAPAQRPSRRSAWTATLLDAALAGTCAAAAATLTVEITAARPAGVATVAVLVAVLHGACVGLRRVAPWLMLCLLAATALAYALLGLPVAFLGPAVLVAAYSIAAREERRAGLVALAGIELALAALVLLGPGGLGADSVLFFGALVAGAWFLGDVARRWRALAEENGRQVRELEEARAELAVQALALERLRIARELHDVVAHSMSMVAMHSGAARLAVGTDPEAERVALTVVERTTRDALAEMRRLVTVLREDSGRDTLGRSPAPGLEDLPRLVADMAAVGMVVDVRTEGRLDAVPPGLSLTAERILQEALTNVARHAGPTPVRVEVIVDADAVRLSVENERGSGPTLSPPLTGGHGLQGMRERAHLYGGTLDAGPTRSGGWRVSACLPREPGAP
jgi:signal transduction histidine kinase